MILSDSQSTIDFSKLESIPECRREFPVACYEYDLHDRAEPWHWHDEFEAAVIQSGVVRLMVEEKEFFLKAGEGYFLNSGALHSLIPGAAGPCALRCVVFSKELVGGVSGSVFWNKYLLPLARQKTFNGFLLRRDVEWQAEMLDRIEAAIESCRQEGEDYEIAVRGTLTSLTAAAAGKLPPPAPEERGGRWESTIKIKRMLLFIWQNYDRGICLSDIAAAGKVSKNDCLLYFRKTIATSPIQYLKSYRLQKAAELLTTTAASVSTVADLCGFPDKSYFSRSFLLRYGLTPLKYRQAQKGRAE